MDTRTEDAKFPWAEQLSPTLLKSPWWIGHIPFAYELIGRLRPRITVELGTYSGSSFAAFCQAIEATGCGGHCYGIDLWEGDIHMGRFDETLFNEINDYVSASYPCTATLLRKDFSEAVSLFEDGSVDLLHIDGTHTFEAVSNDFNGWLPKLSTRSVVLFHDINVTVKNRGPAALRFGVRRFFDSVSGRYPHFKFAHCYGLGVLVTGPDAPSEVMELVDMARSPDFERCFAVKGEAVSKRFQDMDVALPVHDPHPMATSLWRGAVNKLHRVSRRLIGS